MKEFTFWIFAIVASLGAIPSARAAEAPIDAAKLEFFEQKIRPLFVDNCYECHSLQSKKSKMSRPISAIRMSTRKPTPSA